MLYGILAGNKVHLSEIARSLNENITLKKTIDRLSRNLFHFSEKDIVMDNYIAEVKKQIDEEQSVIVIDNSDITKPCSPKMEAISGILPVEIFPNNCAAHLYPVRFIMCTSIICHYPSSKCFVS
jgi:hypothetical protein